MTDPWLTLRPVLSLPISIGLLAAVGLFIIWLEWKRALPLRWLRLTLSGIALVALCGIILRPHYKTQKFNTTALLTTGYSPDKADSLIQQYPQMTLIHAPGIRGYKNSIALTSWNEVSITYPSIDFVIGEGLPPAARDLIAKNTFQFLPASAAKGITQINVNYPVFPNRKNVVEGTFFNADSSAKKIYFEGPGGREDSIAITKSGNHNFKLHFVSKEPGNFLYTLRLSNGVNETFPVHVQDHQRFNILFILQYPTFESRYLKTALGKQHNLAVRYQLSKNTVRYEYINHKPVPISRLRPESLALFDLVIIDTDALQILSAQEVQALRRGIREGSGMILLFNQSPDVKSIRKLSSIRFKSVNNDTAQFQITSNHKVTLSAWKFEPDSENVIIATLKNKNRILSGYEMTGLGKVGFQLLQETYQLLLKGDSVSYQGLWSFLVEHTARPVKSNFTIQTTSPWPCFTDDPIDVEIISTGTEPELFQGDHRISLAEDALVDDVWKATIRVDHPGWHALLVKNDSTRYHFYVSEKNKWKSLTSVNNQRQTALMASSSALKNLPESIDHPISPLVFYVMFVFVMGVLWFLPKR